MTVIELPDEEAAALTAKAAAAGLPLKDWLSKLSGSTSAEAIASERNDEERPIWEVITDMMKNVPDEVFDRLPRDGASQIDHYIYGLSKRD